MYFYFFLVFVIPIIAVLIPLIMRAIYEANCDEKIFVKSSRAVDSYDIVKYIKEDNGRLDNLIRVINQKKADDVEPEYVILVKYISPAGRKRVSKKIRITEADARMYKSNPSLWMSAREYNKLIKEQNKTFLEQKHHRYYDAVNNIIDVANNYRNQIIVKSDKDELDHLMDSLFDRTVNSIKKIKDPNSEEWDVIGKYIDNTKVEINKIFRKSQLILNYYKSNDFKKIKSTVDSLMISQKEFNEYISQKTKAISEMFGVRITRNDTVVDDKYNYIPKYKKSITPFTAEVSAQVFASAENNPIDYIVKYFYQDKDQYPAQIQKLQLLVEELETLKDAKIIIDNYKKDYHQYITNVPSYVMEYDEDGFYSRLGFANISESALTVEYKFSYTSNGGFAQRSFSVPMTEDTIVDLINALQSKLTMASFSKEQRALMTSKLRNQIKERDNYTCKLCVFFASLNWRKLQTIFGECCISKMAKVATALPAA